MTSSPTIRKAEPGDLDQLLKLMRSLARFERYLDDFRVTVADLAERGFPAGGPPEFTAFVAQASSGDLLGYALVYEVPFTYDLKPTIVLKELFVDEAGRSCGTGTLLWEAVIRHSEVCGAGRLNWLVLPDNEAAKRFYRRHGGTVDPDWEHWRLRLGAEGGHQIS